MYHLLQIPALLVQLGMISIEDLDNAGELMEHQVSYFILQIFKVVNSSRRKLFLKSHFRILRILSTTDISVVIFVLLNRYTYAIV